MKVLIERLRYPVICTLDDRIKAADALERLVRERDYANDVTEAAKSEIERLTAENHSKDYTILQMVQDYAKLTAERDSFQRIGIAAMTENGTLKALKAENAALKEEISKLTNEGRDAERYRVLRAWPWAQAQLVQEWPTWGPGTAYPEAADVVDARIDWYVETLKEQTP